MRPRALLLSLALFVSPVAGVDAQSPSPNGGASGAVVGGSPDVSVGEKAAARQGDAAKDGSPVVQGSRDVFINGKPAATAGGGTACGAVVVSEAPTVLVNGKPIARAGEMATGCERK